MLTTVNEWDLVLGLPASSHHAVTAPELLVATAARLAAVRAGHRATREMPLRVFAPQMPADAWHIVLSRVQPFTLQPAVNAPQHALARELRAHAHRDPGAPTRGAVGFVSTRPLTPLRTVIAPQPIRHRLTGLVDPEHRLPAPAAMRLPSAILGPPRPCRDDDARSPWILALHNTSLPAPSP